MRAVASQLFWLVRRTQAAGNVRRHDPDFFVRSSGNDVLLVNFRPLDRIEERGDAAFAATQQACDRPGWHYAVWGSIGAVLSAKYRWLAASGIHAVTSR